VSLRALRRATLGLGVLGLAVAGYLTYVHYAGLQPFCLAGGGGCETVQSSKWASLGGVPVAVLGLIGYAGILASLALPEETGRSAAALLSLMGFGFSAYLTYLELFEIHAICQWCVASAIVMTLLAGVSVARLLRYEDAGPASTASPKHPRAHKATDAPAASSR
jgi:uncharacterized membrane protein